MGEKIAPAETSNERPWVKTLRDALAPSAPSIFTHISDTAPATTPTNGNGAEAWILFRASGTEPLLRAYAEASSPEIVEEVLAAGESFVRSG